MFRWFALLLFVGSMLMSGWYRRRARKLSGTIHRVREPLLLIAGRLAVALPLFGGVFVYLAYPPWMEWASVPVPSWARWGGVGIGLVTTPFLHWVLRTLGSNISETVLTKDDHELVTTGPYAWVRHPLYSAGIALFMSVGLMAANGFILLWALVALVSLRFVVIPREEEQLIRKFGDAYRRYRKRTGALLPGWVPPPAA